MLQRARAERARVKNRKVLKTKCGNCQVKAKGARATEVRLLMLTKSDSDDDSLGFEDDEMAKVMEDVKKKSKAKKPVVISVSHGFVNVGTNERIYLVSFQSLRNVFYLKAEHF